MRTIEIKMRTIEINIYKNGDIVITTETPRSIFSFELKPKVKKFLADTEFPEGYWNWMELPEKTMVDDNLSFQLSTWMRRYKKETGK